MRIALLAAAGIIAASSNVSAAELITNGGFEVSTNGPNFEFDRDTVFTGWTSNGYNFGFAPGTADTVGSTTSQYGNLKLWGPGTGEANGLTAASPAGGNYIAADGAFQVAPISQVVNGLVAGKKYNVKFYWAGAQQYGFTGATTEQWEVKLGNQSISTAIVNNVNHGFTGWMSENFQFTAQNATETLSFLAHGTPDGVPPFSLLDGVSMQAAVPEPAQWGLMLAGFGALGAVSRRRRQRTTVSFA